MIYSQANHLQDRRSYTFILYKSMDSDGKSKDSNSWMGMRERTQAKYMNFILEFIT